MPKLLGYSWLTIALALLIGWFVYTRFVSSRG